MTLPPPDATSLRKWLVAMERRRRSWKIVDTLARLLIVGVIAVGVLIALDAKFTLSASTRTGAAMLLVAFAIVITVYVIARNLRRIDPVASARAIETLRPELDERLLTLAGTAPPLDPSIERQLQDGVTGVLSRRPLRAAWPIGATLALVVLALLSVAGLADVIVGMGWAAQATRLRRPWAAAANTQLTLSASPAVSYGGSPVAIEADLQRTGDEEPIILHVIDANGEATIAMTPQGQNRFVRTLSRLLQGVELYATAGEVRSPMLRIAVHLPTPRP